MTNSHLQLSRRGALVMAAAGSAIASQTIGAFQAFGQDKPNSSYPGTAIGRFHTDFVPSQVAPGRVLGENNSQPGVKGDALSYDAKGNKAVTVIFRYPTNWSMPKPHYVNSDQEFYILEGSVNFDGTIYKAGDYAYLPAGYYHGVMKSDDGCTMLNFYEGEHLAFYEQTPAGMYVPAKLIKKIQTGKLKWKALKYAAAEAWGHKPQIKVLRNDDVTGETTFLIKVAADKPDKVTNRRTATHSAVEEMYVIDGEISTPRGVMKSGAYVWRAPGTVRGPFGSKTGYTALVRSKGGALNTKLSDASAQIEWDAPYQPIISDSARNFAFKTFAADQKY